MRTTNPRRGHNLVPYYLQLWFYLTTTSSALAPYDPATADIALSGAPLYRVGRREFPNLDFKGVACRTTVYYPAERPTGFVVDGSLDAPSSSSSTGTVDLSVLFPPLIKNILGVENTDLTMPALSSLDAPLRPPVSGKRYPVVSFLHSTNGSHQFSSPMLEHIAARGFVILASDEPCNSFESGMRRNFDVAAALPSWCPTGLEIADFVRNQLYAGQLTVPSVSSEGATTIANAVQRDHYALVGWGVDVNIFSVRADDRVRAVQLTAELMSDTILYTEKLASIYSQRNKHWNKTDNIMTNPFLQYVMGWGPVFRFANYVQVLPPVKLMYSTAAAAHKTAVNVSTPDGFKWTISLPGITEMAPGQGFCYLVWQNFHQLHKVITLAESFDKLVAAYLQNITVPCGSGTQNERKVLTKAALDVIEPVTVALVRAFGGAAASRCAGTKMAALSAEATAALPKAGQFLQDNTVEATGSANSMQGTDDTCSFREAPVFMSDSVFGKEDVSSGIDATVAWPVFMSVLTAVPTLF